MYPLLNPSTRSLIQWAKSTGVLARISPLEVRLPRPSLATIELLRRIYAVCVKNWFLKTAALRQGPNYNIRVFTFALMKPHKSISKK